MPSSLCRIGRILRFAALLAALGLIFGSLSSITIVGRDGLTNGNSDKAQVLGARATLPGKYVSPSGNDGNSGNDPDQAYKTMSYAVKQLSPGDTLYVMEGEYFDAERPDSAIVINTSGTANAWIRITAFPGATPVLRSNQSNGIKIEGASYVEVSNLELIGNPNGGTSSYSGSGINADAIYGPGKNHHVRIIGNTVSGFGAGGIPITGTSHVEIRNNTVYDVANVEWTQHSGISILESFNMGFGNDGNGYSNYITGNTIYRVENKVRDRGGRFTDGNCIIMDRTKINSYTGRTLIANNLCLDSGGRGVQIFESMHADVVNNTIYQNLKTGEIASGGGELGSFYSNDVNFANNLVFTRDGLIPARTYDSSNIKFTNNLYVGGSGAQYNGATNSGDSQVGAGTPVVASPGTNPNPGNFDLVSGSPAINAGSGAFNAVVKTDFNGAARPAGGAPDIGAFESGSSAPSPTTAPPATAAPTTAAPTTAAPTTAAPATTQPSATTSGNSSSGGASTTKPTVPPTTSDGTEPDSGGSGDGDAPLQPTLVPRPPTTAGAEAESVSDESDEGKTNEPIASSSTSEPAVQKSGSEETAQTTTSTDAAADGSTSSSAPSSTAGAVSGSQEEAGVSASPPSPSSAPSSSAPSLSAPSSSAPSSSGDSGPSASRSNEVAVGESSSDSESRSGDGGFALNRAQTRPAESATSDNGPSPAEDWFVQGGDPSLPGGPPGTVLAFDDSTIPQAPVPPELPLGLCAASLLLVSYYRPMWRPSWLA